MRFTLKSLGRLEEATIDLGRDLIVLTGPNNTSKTYVAHAIYGFCKTLRARLLDVVSGLVPREEIQGKTYGLDVGAFIRSHAGEITTKLGALYQADLADVFAAEDALVARARIEIDVDASAVEALASKVADAEYHDRAGVHGRHGLKVYVDKTQGAATYVFHADDPDGTGLHELVAGVVWLPIESTLFSDVDAPYILTAERSAIQLFSRELSAHRSDLVDALLRGKNGGSDPMAVLSDRARRYPLPIRDGLRVADDLAVAGKQTSPFAWLADRLEQEIMGGAVRVGDDGDMTFHPDGGGAGMRMHLVSSSVKALSGLSFYLRHLAQRGNFLIIDEPELNLHPDNQRRVAKLLVRLARSGVKVMISTHSDYVIRELNNAIMLSADTTGELRRRYGYEPEDTLSPAHVGAYLFDTSRAHAVEVAPTGIEVATIDQQVNALNVSSQDIYFSLFQDRPS